MTKKEDNAKHDRLMREADQDHAKRTGEFIDELKKLISLAKIAALAKAINFPGHKEAKELERELEIFVTKWAPR